MLKLVHVGCKVGVLLALFVFNGAAWAHVVQSSCGGEALSGVVTHELCNGGTWQWDSSDNQYCAGGTVSSVTEHYKGYAVTGGQYYACPAGADYGTFDTDGDGIKNSVDQHFEITDPSDADGDGIANAEDDLPYTPGETPQCVAGTTITAGVLRSTDHGATMIEAPAEFVKDGCIYTVGAFDSAYDNGIGCYSHPDDVNSSYTYCNYTATATGQSGQGATTLTQSGHDSSASTIHSGENFLTCPAGDTSCSVVTFTSSTSVPGSVSGTNSSTVQTSAGVGVAVTTLSIVEGTITDIVKNADGTISATVTGSVTGTTSSGASFSGTVTGVRVTGASVTGVASVNGSLAGATLSGGTITDTVTVTVSGDTATGTTIGTTIGTTTGTTTDTIIGTATGTITGTTSDGTGTGTGTGDGTTDGSGAASPAAPPSLGDAEDFGAAMGRFVDALKSYGPVAGLNQLGNVDISGGECPALRMDTGANWFGTLETYAHCELLENNRTVIQMLSKVVFVLAALFLFMGA